VGGGGGGKSEGGGGQGGGGEGGGGWFFVDRGGGRGDLAINIARLLPQVHVVVRFDCVLLYCI